MASYTPQVREGDIPKGKKGEVTGKITTAKSGSGTRAPVQPEIGGTDPYEDRAADHQEAVRQEQMKEYREMLKLQIEKKQRAKFEERQLEKAKGGAQTGLQIEPLRQPQPRLGPQSDPQQEELQRAMEMERERERGAEGQGYSGETGEAPPGYQGPRDPALRDMGQEEMKQYARPPPENTEQPQEYQEGPPPGYDRRPEPEAEPERPPMSMQGKGGRIEE
jgi:hypothetical protein